MHDAISVDFIADIKIRQDDSKNYSAMKKFRKQGPRSNSQAANHTEVKPRYSEKGATIWIQRGFTHNHKVVLKEPIKE